MPRQNGLATNVTLLMESLTPRAVFALIDGSHYRQNFCGVNGMDALQSNHPIQAEPSAPRRKLSPNHGGPSKT